MVNVVVLLILAAPLVAGNMAIPAGVSYLDRAPVAFSEQSVGEVGMVRGEFRRDVPGIGTRFSSMFQRKAYNAVVGTLSMNSKVGPVAASATVDPAHRVYFDAALKGLGSKLSVESVFVPERNSFRPDYPRVTLDTTVPLPADSSLSITAAGVLADPFASKEGATGPQHGKVRGVFRDDFEVEMRYKKGALEMAASTQLNVAPSTGPVVALSSGARAGVEYKGLGIKVASEGSLLHLMQIIQNEVDRILLPEEKFASKRAADTRGAASSSNLSSLRCGGFWVEEGPEEEGQADVWTATAERRVGNVDFGAVFSGRNTWVVGAKAELPEVVGSARLTSNKRLVASVAGRIGEQMWVRFTGDVDLSQKTPEAILRTRRFGLRFLVDEGEATSPPLRTIIDTNNGENNGRAAEGGLRRGVAVLPEGEEGEDGEGLFETVMRSLPSLPPTFPLPVLPIQDPKHFFSELGAHLKSALKDPVKEVRATGEKGVHAARDRITEAKDQIKAWWTSL